MNKKDEARGKLWAVVTGDREKASEIISSIENKYKLPVIKRKIGSKNIELFFEDGVWLRWKQLSDNVRCYRYGKLWCDITYSDEFLRLYVLPYYYGRYEDIVWF